jgi:tetratricopeptide (TPR) repeat protein
MNKFFLLFTILLLSSTTGIYATDSYTYELTPPITQAYKDALSLRFDDARQQLATEQRERPNNLMIYFVENYIDFFTIFINENYTEFSKLENNKSRRLSALANGPSSSPYYLYAQAEVQLQWALARLKFEENVNAMREIKKALGMLEQNKALFPDFMANQKSLGVIHALVGTIPDNYQWAVKIVGMSGTIKQGKNEIKKVLDYAANHPEFLFKDETLVMYTFVLLHLSNQPDEAWTVIKNARMDTQANPLACFTMASVAMHAGQNEEAIKILSKRPTGAQYMPFYYLDYMLGVAKLRRLDSDAGVYIRRYLDNFKGINYIKDAYQHLAWSCLINTDITGYSYNMQNCKLMGRSIIEPDQEALETAISGEIPDITLLKARLLFDGGYYLRAEQLLNKVSSQSFANSKEQLEYLYRLGRIYHKQNKTDQALTQYTTTLQQGRSLSYYFACNAALQMGLIYESRKDYINARAYFKECLTLQPAEYKDSLHQKAKAGLNRIKNL